MDEGRLIELFVDEDAEELCRLDQYLTAELSGEVASFSRSQIQKLIGSGMVTLDGKKARAGSKLKGGELIAVTLPPDVPLSLTPEDIPLDVVYEDSHLIVVNKRAGMVTHPGAGVTSGTLVNALLHRCGSSLSGISGVLRPGIVHRLDKDTSGLLVVAKDNLAHQSLARQIKEKEARRIYTALLEGTPPATAGLIDKPIGRHRQKRKQMAVSEGGRPARTHWEVLRQYERFCLIQAKLETGRTHQIRVHMASIGCPVVGDIVYNSKSTGTLSARRQLGLVGHALHATFLSFVHPSQGRLLEFVAPLPDDFQNLVASL